MVSIASLFGARHLRDVVENKPASFLVVSLAGLRTQTSTRSFCRTRKYLKQVQVNFDLCNIITTEFKKNEIFLLKIKDLMQKVGLSQAFSKLV